MRVFVAGASGAIGTRLVPQLIARGHQVIGTLRSMGNAERVRALGAEPIVLDLLDARAVRKAVLEIKPEADRPPSDRSCESARLQAFRPQLRADQPAPDPGHRRAPRRRPRGGRAAVRCPELRERTVRARRRAGQNGGRSPRPYPGGSDARDQRGDAPPGPGSYGRGRNSSSIRRLLWRPQ